MANVNNHNFRNIFYVSIVAKKERTVCGLYSLAFHNPDLLFSQPVKLVDKGFYT
jgi:hypothetical protein